MLGNSHTRMLGGQILGIIRDAINTASLKDVLSIKQLGLQKNDVEYLRNCIKEIKIDMNKMSDLFNEMNAPLFDDKRHNRDKIIMFFNKISRYITKLERKFNNMYMGKNINILIMFDLFDDIKDILNNLRSEYFCLYIYQIITI